MQVRLSQLAELTGGVIDERQDCVLEKATPLHAADARSITFAENPDKLDWDVVTEARAVVIAKTADVQLPERFAVLRVDEPKAAFEKIAAFFKPRRTNLVKEGISPQARVAESASIGKNVAVAPFVTIGEDCVVGDGVTLHAGVVLLDGVSIGPNTTLFPNVVVYENCVVGANCIIHANSVIGAYGFGYESSTGVHVLTSQYGIVVIEDNVEIGACATIDRAAYDCTKIGEGTKIDNHVMIAHNCTIGARNMICASVGVAGSVTTGDYVVMAGQVGVRDHLKVGKGAVIGAMAGVMLDVPEGARIVGIPATPEKEQMRKQVALAKLPETQKEFKALKREVAELAKKIADLEQKNS
ncbi:MAG: UDP-3-O-(3-hydroxymyristoyl)glucosamine N-acyltransferase [Thermoguttaceae bacterium]|jgi:UDP-3-O-[3-hydroxymyristoyl] glucosamine N-acyltransferase|nr:UDP-3-O-(3-hydroxymyristoyl)glucosamine N-acyltransferase [Thermoguttaceae bacterium]